MDSPQQQHIPYVRKLIAGVHCNESSRLSLTGCVENCSKCVAGLLTGGCNAINSAFGPGFTKCQLPNLRSEMVPLTSLVGQRELVELQRLTVAGVVEELFEQLGNE
jgi:hypothetical protein